MSRKRHSFHSFIHGQKHQADKFTPNDEFDPQKKTGGTGSADMGAGSEFKREQDPQKVRQTCRDLQTRASWFLSFTPQKQLLEVM